MNLPQLPLDLPLASFFYHHSNLDKQSQEKYLPISTDCDAAESFLPTFFSIEGAPYCRDVFHFRYSFLGLLIQVMSLLLCQPLMSGAFQDFCFGLHDESLRKTTTNQLLEY